MQSKLVYILGSSHSGLTLLDLLLNNHPQVQTVGEFHRISMWLSDNREHCTCGAPISECPFWTAVEQGARKARGHDGGEPLLAQLDPMLYSDDVGCIAAAFQMAILLLGRCCLYRACMRWIAPSHFRAVNRSFFWYDLISHVSGCPIVLDSTKDLRRMKMLYLTAPLKVRLIFMARDGRGVTASAMRRKGLTMSEAAEHFRRTVDRAVWSLKSVPRDHKIRVNYEGLCADPERTLRTVCEFLNIDFMPDMLRLRKRKAHNISGNPMRFRKDEAEIKLDETWRDELSRDDLEAFDRIAGASNRRLGYND